MVAAVGLREQDDFESSLAAPSRGEVLARYRRLRAISVQHHSEVLEFLSQDAILHHARRLGLAQGKTLVLDDMEELHLAFDLAIHTAETGRSRAIERYARSAQLTPGSDEALVLAAMCRARFSIVSIRRRHEAAGLIAKDLIRGIEHWLVDEGLEISVPDGSMLATRLYTPDRFSMTAGVNVPVGLELMEDVIDEMPRLGRKPVKEAIDDRRFAETIYRIALASGTMAHVAYQDVPSNAHPG